MAAYRHSLVNWARQSALGLLVVALCVTAGCTLSEEREIEIGRANVAELDEKLTLVTDSVVGEYVQSLGLRIASQTSRANLPWKFTVVDSKDVNAFAVPGGFIYVNRGLIERADRMDELAGVLGHEIGHVVRRHSVQQIKRGGRTRIGIALFCSITSFCDSQTARIAIDVGGAAWLARHSRAAEAEADSEAVANTVRAGISPEGIPAFFNSMLSIRRVEPGLVQTFFGSHPIEEDRITQTKRLVDRVDRLIERTLARDDSSFRAIKRRLESLPRPSSQGCEVKTGAPC